MTSLPASTSADSPLHAAILGELSTTIEVLSTSIQIDEMTTAFGTHVGLRRKRNEDRLGVARINAASGEIYTLAIVCDGVGGSESGDEAASLAIAAIVSDLSSKKIRIPLKRLAVDIIQKADDQVRTKLAGRGTTTLVLLLGTSAGLVVCAAVGDSRVYSWDNIQSKIRQVTVDDTLENELRNIPGDHSRLFADRGLTGQLSQAIGEGDRTSADLRVQVYTRESFSSGAILGSDGLWRIAKDFEAVTSSAKSATEAVKRSIALANWVGGVDNTSIIAIEHLDKFAECASGDGPSSQITTTFWSVHGKLKFAEQRMPMRPTNTPAVKKQTGTRKKNPKANLNQLTDENQQLEIEGAIKDMQRPKLEVNIKS